MLALFNPARNLVYRAIRPLGAGGFGTVFVGDVRGIPVAIKVIRPTQNRNADVRAWNLDQRAHLICLNHPNVVRSFDQFISHEGYLVLVTELARISLHDLIAARGPLSDLAICRLGADIAAALQHAHGYGLIHRDVTPKNVLVFDNWIFKLNDFGICKICGSGGDMARSIIGLPSFMPPELVTNQFSVVASDIYQLGMVLLTAMTGQYPIPLDVTSNEAYRMVRDGVPRQIAESLARDRHPLAELIALMLRRRLHYRLASAADARAAFAQFACTVGGGNN